MLSVTVVLRMLFCSTAATKPLAALLRLKVQLVMTDDVPEF